MSDLPPTRAKVLLVDDRPENLVALEGLIRDPQREVFCAGSGEEALELMLSHDFALALLDVQMPSMNGFELAELMRGTERTRRIPIVFVTAAGQETHYAFKGYELGAVDVLHKPLDPHAVRSKVSVFCELYLQREALARAQEELQRAVSMRDDFISMASHELRSPLNTLYLQTQLRRKMLEPGSVTIEVGKLRQMADRDDRQVRNMIRLIDDMLDATRAHSGKLKMSPEPVDMARLVRRVVAAQQDQAQAAGVTLTVETPPELPVTCDEFRIEQVVTNLVTNAFRYGEGQPVQVSAAQEGDLACVTVRDQGMGIAAEDQERIFQQFERAATVEQQTGLGLGLFICRQIVEAHRGTVAVVSAPGEGAAFTVRIPRTWREAPAPDAA